MTVYLINIFLILLWDFLFLASNKKKDWFCAICSFQWVLISGLRAWSVGADTLNYSLKFSWIGQTSWKSIFNAMYKVYIQGYEPLIDSDINFLYKDPGYHLFQKVCHIFTDNYQVYLLIVAFIIFASMGRFVYKYSEDPCVSFILFSSLFYGFFAVTGIRQSLATALVLFIGFDFVKERKFFKFILIALLAYTIHKSVLVFAVFYFLGAIKVGMEYIGFVSLFTAGVFAAGPGFVLRMARFLGYDKDEVYDLPPVMYVIAILLVAVMIVVFYKRILLKSKDKNWEISATLLAASLSVFALLHQGMMRVQQYYSLFLMLSIPSLFCIFENKSKTLIRFGFIFVLIAYLIKNNPQYRFFWQ